MTTVYVLVAVGAACVVGVVAFIVGETMGFRAGYKEGVSSRFPCSRTIEK